MEQEPRLTINDMKRLCNDFFFSPNTMRFFRGSKYQALYIEGKNYIKVTHADREPTFYRYNAKTNKTEGTIKLD